jgi:protein TonB
VKKLEKTSLARRALHYLAVVTGAGTLTLVFFVALPLIQAISEQPAADYIVRAADTGNLPPPPPPPPEEEPEEPEEEPEEPPPELQEDTTPLDLSQLELVLNPGGEGGWMNADFNVKLDAMVTKGADSAALFSLNDLDQKPRCIYQPSPSVNSDMRRKAPGTVYVLFIVNENGRVEDPIVQSSSDQVFERASISAVKKWKFEPGTRNGTPVRFRMRRQITFPKG